MKTAAFVFVFIVLGAGLSLWYIENHKGMPFESYSWNFEELGEDSGVPRTEVALKVGPDYHTIGTYTGTCFDMKGSSWKMDANEIAGAVCWWAGGGQEIGVYNENGRIVVKVGDLDEGTAETGGFRGNFKTVLEIK
ncbi:MAG: hypothetical protein AAB908_02420 [Patescibacteria group bacterium]